jgi:hypothetical protein
MEQAFIAYQKTKGVSRRTDAVEGSLTKHQEDCKRRVALATNGVSTEEINKRIPHK